MHILIIMEKVKIWRKLSIYDLIYNVLGILRIEDLNKDQLAASHIVATRARFVC